MPSLYFVWDGNKAMAATFSLTTTSAALSFC